MTLRAKNFLRPALAAFIILLIPATAMQFTAEVNWSFSDFVIMGALIFCTGLAFEVVMTRRGNTAYRIAFGIAILLTLFLIWANLAVGFVGSGPNLPNILLGLAPFVVLIGSIAARLRPQGMARTMYAMAIAVASAPLIGLIVNRPRFDEGVLMVLGITAFFSLLYVVSAVLFRNSAADEKPAIG
jgi:hypothetical protein